MDIYQRYRIQPEDMYLFSRGEAQQAYLIFGCHYIEELCAHRFLVWAPNAKSVSVSGDFNSWSDTAHTMEKLPGGVFACLIKGLNEGSLYKYAVFGADGRRVLKADPFAFHAEVRPNTASKICNLAGYDWRDSSYMTDRAKKDPYTSPMSIYELHLGSFRLKNGELPSVRELAGEVAGYIKRMGYTHIELLPITEYPLDMSWGYQVTGYFAPTSRWGEPADYMYFIDVMHENGIGVIMDWVPAHFPRDEHGLARFDGTCLYEHADPIRGEHPQWGTYIFNYSRNEVKSFLISSAMYFADIYHIDGIRADAVTSMLYLDYARENGRFVPNREGGNIDLEAVDFLRSLNGALHARYPGFITVAEESTAYPKVTHPPSEGGLGFTFKWNMGFMHDTLEYMSMDPLFRKHHHDKLTFSMMYAFSERFILPYSHDECVHGKGSMIGKMFGDYWQKFASLRALYMYMFAHPGKKLMFMGDELAQFIEWDEKREPDWFLAEYPSHGGMLKFAARLNAAYVQNHAFYENDLGWEGFLWLKTEDAENSALAFMRRSAEQKIVCVFNFTPVVRYAYPIGLPEEGSLELILNSDHAEWGGSGVSSPSFTASLPTETDGFPHCALITLPPLSGQYFIYSSNKEENEQEGENDN